MFVGGGGSCCEECYLKGNARGPKPERNFSTTPRSGCLGFRAAGRMKVGFRVEGIGSRV